MFKGSKSKLRFGIKGNKLVTDQCIWCDSIENLTKAHLFPKSIGGNFKPLSTCKECNEFLGAKYEKEVHNNAFITAALVATGLEEKRTAYRYGTKIDEKTGLEMTLTRDGRCKPVPVKEGEKRFIGTPEEMKAYWVAWLRKKRPNWPVEPLIEFFDDPKRTKFKYACETIVKRLEPSEKIELRIDLPRDPHPFLIMKIVYESLTYLNFQKDDYFSQLIAKFITVDGTSKDQRILIRDEIGGLIIPNTQNSFREFRKLEDIPFKKRHYIVMRLSKNGILYLEVNLFGQLRNFFVIGQVSNVDIDMTLLDLAIIFPFKGNPYQMRYMNLVQPIHTKWADAAVELRYNELIGHKII